MKLITSAIIPLVVMFLAVGCDDSTGTGPSEEKSVTVEIGLNESVAVSEFGISLHLVYVWDSRCPMVGYCDWPGMAQVTVLMEKASDSFHVILPIYGSSVAADTAEWMPVDVGLIRLTLTSLYPYPPVYDSSEYRATIRISPAQTPDSITGPVRLTNQTPSQIILYQQYLDSVKVSGNLLDVYGFYPNGCIPKYSWAFMTPDSFLTAGTREIHVYLRHFHFGDGCPAVILPMRHMYDLSEVIEQYQSQFNRLDPIAINVHPDESDANVRTAIWYPPDWQPTPLFPMWIGTKWVYVDTNRTVQPMEVTWDTVEVTGSYTDSLGEWWTLSHPFPTTTDTVMLRGDTLFDLRFGLSGDIKLLTPQYIPAVDTPVTYDVIVDGCIVEGRTAARVDTMICNPVDTFVGAFEYSTYLVNVTKRQYIVPGIGFVYFDWEQFHPVTPGPARRVVLTELHLVR